MKKKFIPNGVSTPGAQSPNVSFSSTATVPNSPRTPTGSPSKRVKKEVGSGTNVSSSGVRKAAGEFFVSQFVERMGGKSVGAVMGRVCADLCSS